MRINSPDWRQLLREQASACDIRLTEQELELLGTFAAELLAWNQKLNLTAIIDPVEVVDKHLIDSLIPAHHLQKGASVLDIGTGAGLPGIPLKIYMPLLKMTLIDGSRKKISFVNYMIRQLGLDEVEARQIRAEKLAEMSTYQQAYDVVICRAVTSIKQFVMLGTPFLKKDGIMIAMKGTEFSEELSEVTGNASGKDVRIISYRLPISGAARTLLVIRP